MYILQIKIDVTPSNQREFEHAVSHILTLMPHSEQIKWEISKEMCRPNMFTYSVEWETEEQMQQHFQHEDFRTLMGAMKALGSIKNARIVTSDSVRDFPLDD